MGNNKSAVSSSRSRRGGSEEDEPAKDIRGRVVCGEKGVEGCQVILKQSYHGGIRQCAVFQEATTNENGNFTFSYKEKSHESFVLACYKPGYVRWFSRFDCRAFFDVDEVVIHIVESKFGACLILNRTQNFDNDMGLCLQNFENYFGVGWARGSNKNFDKIVRVRPTKTEGKKMVFEDLIPGVYERPSDRGHYMLKGDNSGVSFYAEAGKTMEYEFNGSSKQSERTFRFNVKNDKGENVSNSSVCINIGGTMSCFDTNDTGIGSYDYSSENGVVNVYCTFKKSKVTYMPHDYPLYKTGN